MRVELRMQAAELGRASGAQVRCAQNQKEWLRSHDGSVLTGFTHCLHDLSDIRPQSFLWR